MGAHVVCRRGVTAVVSDARRLGATKLTAVGLSRLSWGARMRGCVRFAALLVAGLLNIPTLAQADETRLTDGVATDATIFETSARVRYGWTEIAFRGDRPKAWDESMSPEFRASLRVLSGLFEGKIEIGAQADRYVEFDRISTDSLRGELQLGALLVTLGEDGMTLFDAQGSLHADAQAREVMTRVLPAMPRVKAITLADFLIAEICCQVPRLGEGFPGEIEAWRKSVGDNPAYLFRPLTGPGAR